MAQPIAPNYAQQFLFPPALEDWVPADHPARFLREFVDQLDLPQLGLCGARSPGGSAALRGESAFENLALRLHAADSLHAQTGAGLPGANVFGVALRYDPTRSQQPLAVLARP